MLEKEQYLALPSLQKEEYVNNILKEILKLNPLGVTVSDIEKSAYFGRSTIWHHMELLASKAECIKMERGDTDVYHYNKVIMHLKELQLDGAALGALFHFDLVENTYGKYVRVQRKRESRSSASHTRSGIVISYDMINGFIEALNRIKDILNSNK